MIKLTLQSQDFLVRMHNSRIRRDWSPQHIIGIGEVDNYNLVLFVDLFSNTNEVVRFQRQSLESKVLSGRLWTRWSLPRTRT